LRPTLSLVTAHRRLGRRLSFSLVDGRSLQADAPSQGAALTVAAASATLLLLQCHSTVPVLVLSRVVLRAAFTVSTATSLSAALAARRLASTAPSSRTSTRASNATFLFPCTTDAWLPFDFSILIDSPMPTPWARVLAHSRDTLRRRQAPISESAVKTHCVLSTRFITASSFIMT